MLKLPALSIYPGDFYRHNVTACSIAAQGLWFRLLLLAHDGERYGYLTLNGEPFPEETLAKRAGLSVQEFQPLMAELERLHAVDRLRNGTILFPELVDAQRLRKIRQNTGKKGGNPALRKQMKEKTLTVLDNQEVKVLVNPLDNLSSSSVSLSDSSFLEERTKEPAANSPQVVVGTKPEESLPQPQRKPRERDWLWDWLMKFCVLAPSFPGGRLGNAKKSLLKNNPTPEQCAHFEKWWWEESYLGGQKGKPPKPEQINESWGEAMGWETVPEMPFEPVKASPMPANVMPINGRKNGNGINQQRPQDAAERNQDRLRNNLAALSSFDDLAKTGNHS